MKRCKWRAHTGPKNPNSNRNCAVKYFIYGFWSKAQDQFKSFQIPTMWFNRFVSFNILSHTHSQRHHTWSYWRSMQVHKSNRFSKCTHEWTSLRRRSWYRSWDWIWQHGDISAFFLQWPQLLLGCVFTSWGLTDPDWLILLCFISSVIPSHRNGGSLRRLCCLNRASGCIFFRHISAIRNIFL